MAGTYTSHAAYAAATSGFPASSGQVTAIAGSGNLNAGNIWEDPENLFYKFAFATDPLAKAQSWQNLNRSLNTQAGPPGYKNLYEYVQALLVKSKLSKSALTDAAALSNVVAAAVGTNTDPFSFLENYATTLKTPSLKQPDTTTQYTKQIQTALQFKDLGDARQYYSDSYFTAWGEHPSAELDKKFQTAWNNQVKEQDTPTTTDAKYEKSPIYNKKAIPLIDPKTKKQKIDKFGNAIYVDKSGKPAISRNKDGILQYKTITTGTTTNLGEGFTAEEQQQFLADFLVANNPDATWNVDNLGGTAKTLFDKLVSFHKANYTTAPDLATLSPLIKNVLSSPDPKVATEFITQYQNGIRNQVAAKYMSIGDFIKAGEDADKYVKPLMDTLSAALERTITENDPIGKKVLNFQDEKGVYRTPNARELDTIIMDDAGFGQTAFAINTAVDIGQNIKSKLGRA